MCSSDLADAWHGDYDLVRGLVGFGLYALDRGARPAARRAADRVVALLAALATREPDGLTWYTNMALVPENERRSEREVDLGKQTSLKLIKIAHTFQRDAALDYGMDRLIQAIAALEGEIMPKAAPSAPGSAQALPLKPPMRIVGS